MIKPEKMLIFLYLSSCVILLAIQECHGSIEEEQLVKDLFDGYNNLIRPVENDTQILVVEIGLSMSQLIDVDEKNQMITTNVWLAQSWMDYRLSWTPNDYGNITSIRVRPDMLWKPNIVLYNNADGQYEVTHESNIIIYSMGYIFWLPPAIYKSSCDIDVLYFPFDQQVCIMKFASWTYNGDLVDLVPAAPKVALEDYWESGQWVIINSPMTKNAIKYPSGDQVYRDVSVNLIIRRKPLFYTVNLVLPCVNISLLTVLVFYLPSDSGEKITLCISVFLALTVFLLLIADIIPASSLLIPLIGRYLLFTMFLVTVSIIITVIILNIHYRLPSTHTMSPWVKRVFLEILPPLLYMKRPKLNHPEFESDESETSSNFFEMKEMNYKDVESRRQINGQVNGRRSIFEFQQNGGYPSMRPVSCHGDLTRAESTKSDTRKQPREFRVAAKSVRFIANHIKENNDYDNTTEDWKYVAAVIDRLCLWVFLIFVIVGTGGMFLQAPLLFEPLPTVSY